MPIYQLFILPNNDKNSVMLEELKKDFEGRGLDGPPSSKASFIVMGAG